MYQSRNCNKFSSLGPSQSFDFVALNTDRCPPGRRRGDEIPGVFSTRGRSKSNAVCNTLVSRMHAPFLETIPRERDSR